MTSSGISGTKREVDDLNKSNKDLIQTFGKFKAGAVAAYGAIGAALAAGGATAAVYKFGKAIVDTGADLERQQIRLETVMKSTERAQQRLNYLIDFSRRYHFEVPGLVDTTIQLEAMGLNAERILPVISDAASVTGQDIRTAADAIISALSGRVMALKQFGINTLALEAELGGKIARGTAEDQAAIIESVLSIMESKFKGGTERLEQTWGGMLGDFGDNWYLLKAKLAQGGMFDSVRGDLKDIRDEMNEFVEAGGLDALAAGFNNAFDAIHTTFFQPLFDDIGNTDTDMARLAMNVERWILEIAVAGGRAAQGLQALLPMLGFIRDLTAEGDLVYTKQAWKIANDNFDSLGGKIGELEKRIRELDETTKALSDPSSLADFARAANVAASRGLDRLGKAGGAVGTGDTGIYAPGGGMAGGGAGGGESGKWTPFLEKEAQDALARMAGYQQEYQTQRLEMHEVTNAAIVESDFDMLGWQMEQAEQYSAFYEGLTAGMYGRLYRFKALFVDKSLRLDRVTAAFGVSVAGEVAKAFIDAKTQQAKIDAAYATAQALSMAGYGNWAGAAKMAAAAAGFSAIAGAGEIAKAFIDREIEERVATLGTIPTYDEGATSRGTRTTGGGVAKTQQATQVFYISITNNVSGDYNVGEGDLTDAEQIQAMFDQGLIKVN